MPRRVSALTTMPGERSVIDLFAGNSKGKLSNWLFVRMVVIYYYRIRSRNLKKMRHPFADVLMKGKTFKSG